MILRHAFTETAKRSLILFQWNSNYINTNADMELIQICCWLTHTDQQCFVGFVTDAFRRAFSELFFTSKWDSDALKQCFFFSFLVFNTRKHLKEFSIWQLPWEFTSPLNCGRRMRKAKNVQSKQAIEFKCLETQERWVWANRPAGGLL